MLGMMLPCRAPSSTRREVISTCWASILAALVQGLEVYSIATPTVEGAKAVLAELNTRPSCHPDIVRKAVVTDLREEAVVYIHGSPFVLRELEHPMSTLKHVGIKGPGVEQLENRLKEDILAESSRSGGRMILHREEHNPVTNQTDIIGYWETITTEVVKTPAEVYAEIKKEGYNIDYKRLPLTREREALATDVDAIQQRLDKVGSEVKYIFISHTGIGGVAYAMAISCLRLQAEVQFTNLTASSSAVTAYSSALAWNQTVVRPVDDNEAFKQGDYRDILSLIRVVAIGPTSKAEVDKVIDK
ncbi:hypothetical protein O6H91_Y473400 [Diphasiastrum complanatum]|nr:hypothetical protein O6H91_Y473400 [Diphasiastrum complanatum]